jgi:hypothetical protein
MKKLLVLVAIAFALAVRTVAVTVPSQPAIADGGNCSTC